MTEWKTYRLGDIASFSQGIQVDIDKQLPYKKGGYVRFIRIVDFTKANEPYRYIETPKKQYLTNNGDIVMIRYGSQTAGLVVKSFEGAIANNMFKITLDEQVVDRDFIYYALSQEDIFSSLRNAQSSSTMPAITFEIASRIQLKIPSLEEQRRIAGILSAIDDKIENNRRINTNLELQAQALFEELICDENLKYEYIANLEHIIETGRRPKGGVANIVNGVPSIGAENIKGLGKYDYSKTKYITEEFAQSLKKGFIKGYELLIYKDGGKPGYFIPNFSIFGEGFPYDKMALNEHVFLLDFGNKGYNFFAYFFFQTEEVMRYLNAQGSKAAIPGINRNDVESIAIPTIENKTVKEFCKRVEPIITAILTNAKESSRLATLRDTLLPKLMNGEIKL